MTPPIIAIDGPAGTGKSTTAREVAARLGWQHVDSGAFYRVAALLALRHDLDPGDAEDRRALRDRLFGSQIEMHTVGGRLHIGLDGQDVTDAIRTPVVTRLVARTADDPGLREIINADLRRRGATRPSVVDGRDIGSVVFPDAPLKIYLDASLEERARRRALEAEPPERATDPAVLASYAQSLAGRDRADRGRSTAPLVAVPDAIHIDTSLLDVPAQVARVLHLAAQRRLTRPGRSR